MIRKILIWVLVFLFIIGAGVSGYLLGTATVSPSAVVPAKPEDTGVQIASQTTVICPSYMTYVDQTRIEKGTGLEGVDFLYVEKQTGLDGLFLMSIAAWESNWGTNYWAKTYNNIMSLGVTTIDPDRTHYPTKTQNVLATAQWLLRGYLTKGAPYYHGGLTQWEIGLSYASDGSWATGVTNMIKTIEGKLTLTQRMKRWMVKTGIFTPDVTWDYEHQVIGWALYKVNNTKTITGR
jgi:hypothetical protein